MNHVTKLYTRYPVLRGMTAYSLLWPVSELCRQVLGQEVKTDKTTTIELDRLLRFSAFGALWVAPTVYCWIKIAGRLVPGLSLSSAITKAFLDQIIYGPFSITTFYYGMSILESKTHDEAVAEAKSKLIPTWKAAATVWPFVQTVNFTLIPEKNRVIFIGVVSFLWTTYLSFMKASNINCLTYKDSR